MEDEVFVPCLDQISNELYDNFVSVYKYIVKMKTEQEVVYLLPWCVGVSLN